MNTSEPKILTALQNLAKAGKDNVTALEVLIQVQEDMHTRYQFLSYGELYRVLNKLASEKVLLVGWKWGVKSYTLVEPEKAVL